MSIFNQMLNSQSNTAKVTDKMIDIDLIIPYERNEEIYPEEDTKDQLESLIENIRDNGLIQAVELRPIKNGMYESIGGNRRCAAIRHLVHTEKLEQFRYVKAVITHMSDLEALERCITSNDYREKSSYTKLKEIEMLTKVLKEKEEKGEKVKGSTRLILSRITKLSETQVQRYQTLLQSNNQSIIEDIKNERISIKEAVKKVKKKSNIESSIEIKSVKDKLEEKYQTSVVIQDKKITFKYIDVDDLNRLLELLGGLVD